MFDLEYPVKARYHVTTSSTRLMKINQPQGKRVAGTSIGISIDGCKMPKSHLEFLMGTYCLLNYVLNENRWVQLDLTQN